MVSREINARMNWVQGLSNTNNQNAHDIAYSATKVALIRNVRHIRNMMLARNTETVRRLGRFGIVLNTYMYKVDCIISYKLGIEDYSVVEDLNCETLRWIEGCNSERYSGMDTIVVDQPLYQIVDDDLHTIGYCGDRKIVNGDELQPNICWWVFSVDNPGLLLRKDDDLVLTHNLKVLKTNLAKR